MCGIAGYVGLVAGAAGETVLRRMLRQLVHRGPDGEGVVVAGPTGLGHRRRGAERTGVEQPLRSAYGRYLMVCDGEVYNFRELRSELAAGNGHTFHTDGDTEVVLASWVRWGPAAFERFNGAFALAILDTATGEVVLARDQFGIRPLYLATDGSGRVAFASELRAIIAAGIVPRRPDDVTVYRYLKFDVHDDTERTFFDRITRLLPGELAVITPGGAIRRETYTRLRYELDWRAADPEPRRYGPETVPEVAAALSAAVRRRLAGDAPVGTTLSGGLDSSTVVSLVQRLLRVGDADAGAVGTVQRAFAALPPAGNRRQELAVDIVAAALGRQLQVHKVQPDPARLPDELPEFIGAQQEPVSSAGAYTQYCLLREASRQVAVSLDGHGADELLGGYYPHLLVYLRQLWHERRLPAAAVQLVRHRGTLWQLVRPQLVDLLRGRAQVEPDQVLAADFLAAHADEQPHLEWHHLRHRLAEDLFQWSLPALLRYHDRNSMRFSVVGRMPFLDPDLIRLIWSMDESALIGPGGNKRALRDATGWLLPTRVRRNRARFGFTAPDRGWLRPATDFVREVYRSESFGSRRYFNQPAVLAAFRSYLTGRSSAENTLFWRLLNLELWLREMVDRDPTVPLAPSGQPGRVLPGIQPQPQRSGATAGLVSGGLVSGGATSAAPE